jgi:hypothetical protein
LTIAKRVTLGAPQLLRAISVDYLEKIPRIGHSRSRAIPCIFHRMTYEGSTAPASILPLLARWRLSLPEQRPPLLAQALRVEAQRCFRLARGIASSELADELDAIGRAFESEAEELETRHTPDGDKPFADELAAAD